MRLKERFHSDFSESKDFMKKLEQSNYDDSDVDSFCWDIAFATDIEASLMKTKKNIFSEALFGREILTENPRYENIESFISRIDLSNKEVDEIISLRDNPENFLRDISNYNESDNFYEDLERIRERKRRISTVISSTIVIAWPVAASFLGVIGGGIAVGIGVVTRNWVTDRIMVGVGEALKLVEENGELVRRELH